MSDDEAEILEDPIFMDSLPPKPGTPGMVSGRTLVWYPILLKVREHPGQWAKIKTGRGGPVNTCASNLRLRKVVVPPGVWEFETRRDMDFPDQPLSRRAVYAKFVRPQDDQCIRCLEVVEDPAAVCPSAPDGGPCEPYGVLTGVIEPPTLPPHPSELVGVIEVVESLPQPAEPTVDLLS